MFAVGNSIWNIYVVDRYSNILRKPDGSYTLGASDNRNKTIYISGAISPNKYEKVLTHELVHAFAFEYHLNLDLKTEEILADFVATYGRRIFKTLDKLIDNIYVVNAV